MKKVVTFIIMLLNAVFMAAQTNPQPGYIITNENDTIKGTIDYLSDIKNMYICHFRADGAQDFQKYKPGEISGYRLTNNGIFYVTRTFPVGDTEQTIFAEYLLKGGVSLYYARDTHMQYYYWVDEDGKVAKMVYDGEKENTYRKKRIAEVGQMLKKSSDAQKRLWKTDYSSKDLVDLTREYDETYCTDAGECVQFVFDSKKKFGLKVRFRIEAGIDFNTVRNKHYTGENWIETSCTTPYVGVGVDFQIPRFSKNLSLETLLTVNKKSGSEEEVDYLQKVTAMHFEYYDLALQLGLAFKLLPQRRVSPFVRGGFTMNEMFGIKTENMNHYKIGHNDQDFRTRLGMGFYIGAGADIAIGTHSLRIVANYLTHNNDDMAILTKSKTFTVGLGFCF
ncbi:MAG: outer membrane beta-barrel protein [Prevotella sp.]|nr:outer membrane beta-barrel protein [Prevotella sp.]